MNIPAPITTPDVTYSKILDKEYDDIQENTYEVQMSCIRKKHNVNATSDEYLNED